MSIFIENLHIENYKCFQNENIPLSVPNGVAGSGLNIFIGENGNGKTAVLEAINYLTSNSFSIQNQLQIQDFFDYRESIYVQAQTNSFDCLSSIGIYKNWRFKAEGVSFEAYSRTQKEQGRLLSSPFQIKNQFIPSSNCYQKPDGTIPKDRTGANRAIDGRDRLFDNSRIADDEEVNIFFFDKNRTRQINAGTYKTTLERICDDLNWKFIKNLTEEKQEEILRSINEGYFEVVNSVLNSSAGEKTAEGLKNFLNNDKYEDLKIEIADYLHPYTGAFFALRGENELNQVPTRKLGSGVEMVLTLFLLKNISDQSKGSIIYLIDEPEMHLHPKAQEKLRELLIEESKNKQIIISTHSPYLFRGVMDTESTLLLFTRDNAKEITIENARDKGWGLFPWSPSWGEINYFAYDFPTIEFHDELYGYLHELYISFAQNKQDAEKRERQTIFEHKYLQHYLEPEESWTREFAGKPGTPEDVTLPTYVRNKTHHPENSTMQAKTISDSKLRDSIEKMIDLV